MQNCFDSVTCELWLSNNKTAGKSDIDCNQSVHNTGRVRTA